MTNRFKDIFRYREEDNLPIKQEFNVNVGDYFTFDIYVSDPSDVDLPFDLSACTIAFTAKNALVDPTIVLTKDELSGITVFDPEGGAMRVTLDDTDTTALGPYGGILYYDVKVTDSLSSIFTASSGKFILSQDMG